MGQNFFYWPCYCKIFHSLDVSRSKKENDKDKSSAVIIGDELFIGAHTIILKGVTIGRGAIVGAGSVVSKSIPAGEVWAGNPVKAIRRNHNCDENIWC